MDNDRAIWVVLSCLTVPTRSSQDGTIFGTCNDNPILETRVYEVVFENGEITECGANVIPESMWAQCDLDGNQQVLMNASVDCRVDDDAAVLQLGAGW